MALLAGLPALIATAPKNLKPTTKRLPAIPRCAFKREIKETTEFVGFLIGIKDGRKLIATLH
jgi:hypothetical protein